MCKLLWWVVSVSSEAKPNFNRISFGTIESEIMRKYLDYEMLVLDMDETDWGNVKQKRGMIMDYMIACY